MNKIFLILFSLIIIGCEEIIEIDLNSASPEIIIEANLTNSIDRNLVTITQSTDFYNPNEYKTISNADVIIIENDGTSYTLDETSPGEYRSNTLIASSETEYSIVVNFNNNNYKASSYAPLTLEIDSLNYKLEPRPFKKEKKRLELHVYFKDDPDIKNYSRFVIYKNGKKINRIFLYNDRLTNGNAIDFFFFNFDENEEFRSGDDILVELQSIDEQTYLYFNTLRKALARSSGGPFGSTAPANPTTNWDNGALGYFSAYSIDSKTIIIE